MNLASLSDIIEMYIISFNEELLKGEKISTSYLTRWTSVTCQLASLLAWLLKRQ